MMRPDAKVEKVYLYPKPVDFRKSIDGLAALVELDIKAAVFDPVLFVFLNKPRNRVKILYWERNGFCLWLSTGYFSRFLFSGKRSQAGLEARRADSFLAVHSIDVSNIAAFVSWFSAD